MKKAMILVIDGCRADYITPDTAPDVFRIASKRGFFKTVQGSHAVCYKCKSRLHIIRQMA